ncbi:MAG: hypothetical protein EBQ80_02650 [Proteobacteria bacterium]|nr:hypothetical protein [Pseudomonadota bacterium]
MLALAMMGGSVMVFSMQKITFLAIVTLLTACAQNPATGGSMFTLVSQQQELAIGQASANYDLKTFGMYRPQSPITRYVTNLCDRLWNVSEMAGRPNQCILLDNPEFNATATPGYITVYRGLLPYVSSEAELAAVLGHEAGHNNARHIAQRQTAHTLLNTAILVGVIAAGQQGASQQAVDGGVQAAQQIGRAGLMTYSRANELEADALGQRYMERAGYDKRESVNMVRGMLAKTAYMRQLATALNGGEDPGDQRSIFSSHPATPDRIAQAAKLAGEPDGSVRLPAGITPATTQNDPQGRKRYLEMLDGTTFGPARKFGIAGKDYLALPRFRQLLALPQGFTLTHGGGEGPDPNRGWEKAEENPGYWQGAHPQSGTTFELELFQARQGINPGALMEQLFRPFEDGGLQKLQLGDTVAYTGALAEKWGGNKRIRAIGFSLPHQNAIGIITITFTNAQQQAAYEGGFLKAMQNSQTLTEGQADKYQPLVIKTFTAATGDSIVRHAQKVPTGALQDELFRALNNLQPNQTLQVGQVYKTIADPNR